MQKASLQKIAWQDIRATISAINPELTAIIDALDPGPDLPLYRARYPYGSTVLKEGLFQIPTADGRVVPMADASIPDHVKINFAYAAHDIPGGIVLNHSLHSHINLESQILPLGIHQAGEVFALWRHLDPDTSFYPASLFSMTAGARFICLLPNISDRSLHKNLKTEFKIQHPPPQSLLEHWDIFKSLTEHVRSHCNWAVDCVFFTHSWFEKIKQDSAWRPFYLYLLKKAWEQSAYQRNHIFYEAVFSYLQAHKNLKPNPYLSSTVKQLFMIAAGAMPGYGVAVEETCAPIRLLQQIYLECYGLKYNPTIFLPMVFQNTQPVYYSLSLPSTLEFLPKSRKLSTTMQDLSELRHVTHSFMQAIKNGTVPVQHTAMEKVMNQMAFDFFHNKPDKQEEIQLTTAMPAGDVNLLVNLYDDQVRDFSASGTLIRGCVRIG
ncbi:MAG: hypothetical protein QM752_07970 [Gammaproteobacteria bacterium]